MKKLFLLIFCTIHLYASQIISVKIGNGEWPPYQSEKLPEYGVLSKIITESFKNENIKVDYQFLPWKRSYILTENTTLDATFVWSKSADREKQMTFSDVVYSVHDVFFFNKDNVKLIYEDMNSLKGLNIGNTIGYDYGQEFNSAIERKIFNKSMATTDLAGLKKLQAGRIDAFPCAKLVCVHMLETDLTLEERKHIAFAEKPFRTTPMYLIVSKKHQNKNILLSKFNAGLKKLKESGNHQRIIDLFLGKK